jgi:type II secretory pathway component GspD/PulD (secretin)
MSGKPQLPDKSLLSVPLVLSLALLIGVSTSWLTPSASGQPSPEQIEQMRKMGRMGPNMPQPQPQPGGQPPSKGPGKNKEGKPDGKKGDDAKKPEKAAIPTIQRPTDPPKAANPDELKAKPDASGRMQFSFRGHPWADVLQWYADVADYSFDWQELPADFLNLTTQRKYTIAETRDLLNRHLLARGFTMVVQGEVMTVVKIDKLDPSLVPRAEADDLEEYAPHEFMRVTFPLPPSMEPAKAAEDVKLLLSPNAKATPLLASKRLLVLDAVANLRDVRDLLYAEQLATDKIEKEKPRQFILQHRRADYVADQIMVVLGLDPNARKTPQELQVEQQKVQMMMKMQQKGKDVSKMLQKDGPKVYLAVNLRQNSILVNAPPELMPTIERTIEMFDIPDASSDSAATGVFTMERYKTITASTDKVIEVLQEIGNLDPRTQLQSDSSSKTIFATATQKDHATITKILDRLDGSGRRATVIWLRRLAADQVAGTLTALIVGEPDKKDDSSRRNRYYGMFGYGGRNDQQKDQQTGFKALADVESNRLLLWATEDELKEVRNILGQLGEIPSDQGGNPSRVRVLQSIDAERATELLRQLESAWSGKNQLRIHGDPGKGPAEKQKTEGQQPEKSAPTKPSSEGDTLTQQTMGTHPFLLAGLQSNQETEGDPPAAERKEPLSSAQQPAAEQNKPPIDVVIAPDGQIILKCDDPAALDELENLLGQLAPASQEEFRVFELHNASASLVVLNLEEYFEEELKGQKEGIYDYWGDYRGSKKKDGGPTSLSKRPLLRFIYDIDTNTIVVQNASPAQLQVIEQLINIYDRPLGEDSVLARRTEAIKIRYSRASDIATALKEVYRDLLSSKDKEFQGKDGQAKTRTETHYRFYGGGQSDDKQKKPAAVKIAFEGALSIGVDELSNTLIISAQEEVWENVRSLVEHLDKSARPNTVIQVHEVSGIITPANLQKALAEAMSEPWPGGKPKKTGGGQAGKGEKGEQANKKGEAGKGKGEGKKGPEQ